MMQRNTYSVEAITEWLGFKIDSTIKGRDTYNNTDVDCDCNINNGGRPHNDGVFSCAERHRERIISHLSRHACIYMATNMVIPTIITALTTASCATMDVVGTCNKSNNVQPVEVVVVND